MNTAGVRLGGMAPAADVLKPGHITTDVLADGRLTPASREQMRRIPSLRNAVSVGSVYAQTLAVIVVAIIVGPWAWLPAVLLMGRAHAQFASLMHEAAHRLLFRSKRANDFVGRWLIGYPAFTNTDAYRRVHMAHHREEFGPDEPDVPLYANYPVSPASLRRKLIRDAFGVTGAKLFRAQLRGLRAPDERVRHTQQKIWSMQIVLLVAGVITGAWWLYPLFWLLPNMTVWRVINRLRSIAEHGGMTSGTD
ncbi:MAG: fatty acid desaturase family protein, partial [Actinomycetota bacterium]